MPDGQPIRPTARPPIGARSTPVAIAPNLPADTPIQYLKGVGPLRAEWFSAAGIHTLAELLEYLPTRYEVTTGEIPIADVRPGMIATIRAEVIRVHGREPGRVVELHDGTGDLTLRWFNAPRLPTGLVRGATIIATGEVQEFGRAAQMIQPTVFVLGRGITPELDRLTGGLLPIYPSAGKLKTPLLRQVFSHLRQRRPWPIPEQLPASLRTLRRLVTREEAFAMLHTPAKKSELSAARKRLAYEEFLLMELAIALRRKSRITMHQSRALPCTPEIDRRIRKRFPFALTPSQNLVVSEIVRDLGAHRPMTRLLQGDVGSGKTVVALYAALLAVANRCQAAIMAPTEILAQQHFHNIEQYLAGSRVRRQLLSGGSNRKTRAENLAAIERGEIDLVVGTQALLQTDVHFARLGLVVVDEQHKFGVLQRHEFRTKGLAPHYLVMTATPIPRTLAMTVFGELDVSIIRSSPPGRGRLITRVVPGAKWATVMNYVRGRLERGEQAYVVCPQIGTADPVANDDPPEPAHGGVIPTPVDASSVKRRPPSPLKIVRKPPTSEPPPTVRAELEKLRRTVWKGLEIGLLHGGLSAAEKTDVVGAFKAGRLQALIATTVVEVGVDVPNATIMIVEGAERFGLSQLHQLRGRVGRGSRESLCVLITQQSNPRSLERLNVMSRTTDGFKIAEADLQFRGPGQLFGTRQHGLPELRYGNLVDDFGVLENAREDAFAIVEADPRLQLPANAVLLPELRRVYGKTLALIDAG